MENGQATTVTTADVTVIGAIDSSCNFLGSVAPNLATTYFKALSSVFEYDSGSNELDYLRIQEWYELGMQILNADRNSHEAFAQAKVFIRRIRKKRRIVLGIPGTTLPPEIKYSPTLQYMNGWVWAV